MQNPLYLQNLITQIKEFETMPNSTAIFDYRNTDPMQNTKIGTMLKHVGANIKLIGASGTQEYDLNSQFAKGASKQIIDGSNQLGAMAPKLTLSQY